MNPSVRIMMATYNGEKYLGEQIESIINQSYENWSLVIQDDGSTDNTVGLLNSYQDSRISFHTSRESRHGAYYNFHSLANQEKQSGRAYDYYMFCDQDDVWDEDKIKRMLKAINAEENDKPVFCYADMRVIDENGEEQIHSICRSQGLEYVNKESLFFSHIIYGCNTIMNRKAFFSVPLIDTAKDWVGILSHDNLYAKFAGMLGKVIYFPETTMGYRRHGGNVTSKQAYGFDLKRIVKRSLNIQDLASDHARTYSQSMTALKLLRETQIGRNEEIEEISKIIKSGGIPAISWLRKKKVSWGNKTKDTSHKLVLLLSLYKKYLIC